MAKPVKKNILNLSSNETSEKGLQFDFRNLKADYPLHSHDYYELEYIVQGTGRVAINNNEYAFKKGSLVFLTPTDLEEVFIDRGEQVILMNISFDENWIDTRLYGGISGGTFIEQYDPKFFDILKRESNKQDEYSLMYTKNIINCLLVDIIRKAAISKKIENSRYSAYVQEALNYINIHFREPITQLSVAKYIGLSQSYFCSLFKKEVNISFRSYLISKRLKYSVSMLLTTNIPIIEVCQQSGFNDLSNYFHLFKKHYGVSPLQFRKQHSAEFDAPVIKESRYNISNKQQ